MATIIPRVTAPQIEVQQGPQVRNTQEVSAAPAMAMADAIGQIGAQIGEYAKKQQEVNDTTAVMAARKRLSDWEASTFDPGNPDGIGKYKGKNALGADEALLPDLDKRVSDISAGLTPKQRQQFEGVAMNFRDSVAGRLNGYMDREHSGYITAEQKAAVDNLGADAVSAGVSGDFSRQDRVANELLAMNRARRQADGMGEELIKAEERGMVSSIRAQTVDGMLTASPFEAQAYFERYADQMSPEDRARVERALYPVVSDAENDSIADMILAGGIPGEAVDAQGSDVDAMIVRLEAGGSDTAKNPRSTATGAGQFLDSTWLDVVRRHRPDLAKGKSDAQILGLRTDGALSREMVTAFREDNARALGARGVAPTAINLYAAHHFGAQGAVRFATLGNEAPMTAVLSRREIEANPYLKGKTVGDVKANWTKRGIVASQSVSRMGGQPTESQALAIADGIRDPRARKDVKAKIRERFQLSDMRRQEEDRAASEAAYVAINQAANPNAPLREILGAQVYAMAERKGQLPMLEKLRKNKITETFTQDDAMLVETLEREAVLSPQTFARRDIHALADRISTQTLGELLGKQKQANDPAKRAEWATQAQRIESGLRVLGLDESGDNRNAEGEYVAKPSKKLLDERKVQRAQFAQVYREAERAFVQRQGRGPTSQEADALLRNVVRNVATDIPGKLSRSGAIEGFGAALPAADRAEIISDFRASTGREPTEAEIVRIGARYRMQQNTRAN